MSDDYGVPEDMHAWDHELEMYEYFARVYWLALTTGDWDAVMVSLWGVG